MYHHLRGRKTAEQEKVPSWIVARLFFDPLKMEVICSSGTSVNIRTTRRYIPENGNFQNYRWENLKSYTLYNEWALLIIYY
jgi:hypothetical protein